MSYITNEIYKTIFLNSIYYLNTSIQSLSMLFMLVHFFYDLYNQRNTKNILIHLIFI